MGPLNGIKVIDLTSMVSGPVAAMMLGDQGAEVVKVEWYKRFDLYRTRGVERLRGSMSEEIRRESSYSFQSLNRNKLGFATDLKREEGLQGKIWNKPSSKIHGDGHQYIG